MPFGADANNRDEIARDISELPLAFTYDDYGRVNAVTRDFLDALLMKDPKDRLTLEEIKAHEYFNGM
jgi:serine/threonine protein kinase